MYFAYHCVHIGFSSLACRNLNVFVQRDYKIVKSQLRFSQGQFYDHKGFSQAQVGTFLAALSPSCSDPIAPPPGGYYIERTLILPYFFIWMKVNFAQMNSLTLRECSKFTETCTGMLIGVWMGEYFFDSSFGGVAVPFFASRFVFFGGWQWPFLGTYWGT